MASSGTPVMQVWRCKGLSAYAVMGMWERMEVRRSDPDRTSQVSESYAQFDVLAQLKMYLTCTSKCASRVPQDVPQHHLTRHSTTFIK